MRLFNTYRVQDPSRFFVSRLIYQMGMVRRFRRELRSGPLDVVHVKTSSGINFYQNALYAWVARVSGFPVLMQIHSGRFEDFYRGSLLPLRAWIRSTLSRCTRVAALSHSWAERVAAIAPKARIRVVPNGLAEEEVARLGSGGEIRSSQVFFLGTGRDDLNREKGLDDLISVLPDLMQRHPQSRWILAGLENAEATCARLPRDGIDPGGKDQRVVCMGLVEPPEKSDLLKTSAILVLPSYYENMPNILLEGMAAGVGVVATDVGAIPEMLGYGEGGLLVPPGDRPALASALDRLLSSPTLVRAQGRRNRLVVARDYTVSVVQHNLSELYLEVAGWQVMRDAAGLSSGAARATGMARDYFTSIGPVSG